MFTLQTSGVILWPPSSPASPREGLREAETTTENQEYQPASHKLQSGLDPMNLRLGRSLWATLLSRRGGAVVQGMQSQPSRTAWPCQQRWQGLETTPPLSLLLLPPPTLGKESEHCMSPDQSSFPKHYVTVFPLGELSFSVWLSHNLSFVHTFTVESLCFRVVWLQEEWKRVLNREML